eukprot:g929.t1
MNSSSTSYSVSENCISSMESTSSRRLSSRRRLGGSSLIIPESFSNVFCYHPIERVVRRARSFFTGNSTSPFDIISLNIRGQSFDLYRSLLCQVKGSQLDIVFNGQQDISLAKDSSGRFLLDMNPKHFGRIVDFLSAFQSAEQGQKAAYPSTEIEDKRMFMNLVGYLGFEDVILRSEKRFSLSQKSNLIHVVENGQTAVHNAGTASYQSVFSHLSFNSGIVQFTLKTKSHKGKLNWMFIGVISENTNATQNSHKTQGSYGWSSDGDVWIRGKPDTLKKGSGPQFFEDQKIVLTLDCTQGYHSLRIQVTGSNQDSEVPFLPKKSWRLQVVLYGQDDQLKILNVEYPSSVTQMMN